MRRLSLGKDRRHRLVRVNPVVLFHICVRCAWICVAKITANRTDALGALHDSHGCAVPYIVAVNHADVQSGFGCEALDQFIATVARLRQTRLLNTASGRYSTNLGFRPTSPE